MSKYCQSCGMPLKDDPEGGGTNSDGSKSHDYCSYCYKDGSFTQPDFTATDMQTFCIEKMQEMKFSWFIAWLFTRNIPRLKRWKEAK